MSILERMKAIIAQKAQTSVEKWQSSTMFVVSGGSKGEGKRQTFSPYAAAMSYRSWVYAAANLNAVAVASVPLRLYVRNRSTGTKLWKTKSPSRRTKAFLSGDRDQRPSNYVLRKAAEYGSDFEVVTDSHPILELLAKVNPYQNGYDATVLRVLYTELTGNAYIHPVLDPATKRPVQLWTMPSQFVEIVPGKEKFIEAYLYGSSREQRKIFAPDEVIHFKRPNPNDLYYGIGKVEAAWSAVQMNAAVHEMDLSFFENKARPDYLMTIRGDASQDEIERLEAQIDEKLRGSRRTGRFLTATADIDIKPLSFPPKDLAGRESIVEEIAAIFGVPVSMLKANDPNLASAQIGYSMWRESTILPMLRMDEEVLNQNLLPLFGIEDDAFLAYDNPVVEDRRLELEEIRTAVSGGWMTVNEARAAEGMEPLDDEFADRALMNGQPLGGMAALPPAPAAPMAQEPTESVPVEPIAKAEVDDCVSSKIPKLIDEGYPQDQAIAIAYSMCREGKSASEAAISLGLSTKAFDVDDVEMKALGDIDTTPPKTVAENARRALEVRASKPESQRGMTAVGIARARDLANRKPLSEDTIRRMLSYFERHEVDKQGSTWDDQGRGWQAWNGWGGDDGFAWSRRKVDEFDRERGRSESKSSACSCGCKSRSVPIFPAKMGSKDCGTGAGGFQPGNTCGSEEGSGDVGKARSRSVSDRATLNESADRKASSLPPTISSDDVESFTEESEFREIATHVTTSEAARSIGDSGFEVRASDDPQSRTTFGRVWGDGVYLGTDAASEALYRELGSTSGRTETVRTVVDIRNPLEITFQDVEIGSGKAMSTPENILKAAGLEDAVSEMKDLVSRNEKKSSEWTTQRRQLIRERVDPTLSENYRKAQSIAESIPQKEIEDRLASTGRRGIDATADVVKELVRERAGDEIASAVSERSDKIRKLSEIQEPFPPSSKAIETAFMTRKLREAGFDSIIVRDEGSNIRESGGNQIVVFDPKRVKVVR